MEGGILAQWLWALFGVLIYNYLSFTIVKDEADDVSKNFKFKPYALKRWDNWVWSLLCVPIIVVYGDDLWYYAMAYFEKDWEFRSVVYLTAGVVAEGLYYLLRKALKIIRALKGNGNKANLG